MPRGGDARQGTIGQVGLQLSLGIVLDRTGRGFPCATAVRDAGDGSTLGIGARQGLHVWSLQDAATSPARSRTGTGPARTRGYKQGIMLPERVPNSATA